MSVKVDYNRPTNTFLTLLFTKDYIIDSLCIYSLLSISDSTDLEIHRLVYNIIRIHTINFCPSHYYNKWILFPNILIANQANKTAKLWVGPALSWRLKSHNLPQPTAIIIIIIAAPQGRAFRNIIACIVYI